MKVIKEHLLKKNLKQHFLNKNNKKLLFINLFLFKIVLLLIKQLKNED